MTFKIRLDSHNAVNLLHPWGWLFAYCGRATDSRSFRDPQRGYFITDAARRFQTVWDDYRAWRSQNPARNAEEYLGDLLKHGQSAAWTVNREYLLRHSSLEAAGDAEQVSFPFPDAPLPRRAVPPFEWAVELLAAVLATPLPSAITNFRYGARITHPFHCGSHSAFWHEVAKKAGHLVAITTKYDILIERCLRHKPMRRGFGPGCYYGGIPRPQLLRGTLPPGTYRDLVVELAGAVPVYKLHGSLNWSRLPQGLELFQDLRPTFRHGGDAAIIPPVPETDIPAWLQPVWTCAEEELARADIWIVCGYSLPPYDTAVVELLRRAAAAEHLTRILILDPQASIICARYRDIAPGVDVLALEGLPNGVDGLSGVL